MTTLAPPSLAEIGPLLAKLLGGLSDLAANDPSVFARSSRRKRGQGAVSRTDDYASLIRIWEERKEAYFAQSQERLCPCCGSAEREPLFVSQDGFPYARCVRCSMWYVWRYLPSEVWARYQLDEPDVMTLHDRQFGSSCTGERYAAEEARFAGYFEGFRPFCPNASLTGLSYLDVGCYTGNSLRVAAAHGMTAYGVDGNPRVVDYVRAHRPELHLYPTIADLGKDLGGRRFHCVSFWEALEHDPEPLRALRRCRELMEPMGILALTVPNAQSALPLLLREYCFYCFGGIDLQGHINLFSPTTLVQLLATAGFEPVSVETIYSTDWEQVLFYVTGQWDKIYCTKNLRSGSCVEFDAPAWTEELAQMIGPDLSRLEKTLRFGPMILLVARAV